jgi:hypothetical protein
MLFQPRTMFFELGIMPGHQLPEMAAMVHVDLVANFMDDYVVHDLRRSDHQPPGEVHVSKVRRTSPKRPGIFYPDLVDLDAYGLPEPTDPDF